MGFSGAEAAPGPGKQAVIGADDETLGDLGDQDSAAGADARVYDGQVDGAGAEAVYGTLQSDRPAEDVLGGTLWVMSIRTAVGQWRRMAPFMAAT